MAEFYRPHTDCRVCGTRLPGPGLDLGTQPLANALPDTPHADVPRAPLAMAICPVCYLGQLTVVVDPAVLFRHYTYTPSQSASFTKHLQQLGDTAADMVGVRGRDSRDPYAHGSSPFAVDIGSNDGLLLRYLRDRHGFRVMGVDPAVEITDQAIQDGIPTTRSFWSSRVAEMLSFSKGQADLITATNVFAHLDDIHDFLRGVEILLHPTRGLAIIEVAYLPALIRSGSFDLVYHEHMSYWSVQAMFHAVRYHGLRLTQVAYTEAHGGSVRFFIERGTPHQEAPQSLLITEGDMDLAPVNAKAARARDAFWAFLQSMGPAAGYTAPAKATVFLNYAGAHDALQYVIDDSPLKQGKYIPGTGTPIVPSSYLQTRPVTDLVVFAWNLVSDIKSKVAGTSVRRLFVPFPPPAVIDVSPVPAS